MNEGERKKEERGRRSTERKGVNWGRGRRERSGQEGGDRRKEKKRSGELCVGRNIPQ